MLQEIPLLYIPSHLKWILAVVWLVYSKDLVIIHFDCYNLHTLKHYLTLQEKNCTNSSWRNFGFFLNHRCTGMQSNTINNTERNSLLIHIMQHNKKYSTIRNVSLSPQIKYKTIFRTIQKLLGLCCIFFYSLKASFFY